ncbi:VOC family protein [Marinilongibacter aquaticus]|uniref:VOC family protein n=1 Tax=Marinilongibacter aquaticus TaxID=2975157 RepID=UPI0021BDDBB6|nr:VOC family protein [Marinilongibacter aquaticus]UBM60172.1 VOC family protein [Marinilongibacter aquaticus]
MSTKTKPRITGTRYVLAVQNLEKSVDFYINQMGFRSDWFGEGWHFLSRDKCMIMLGECPDERPAFALNDHAYFAYIEVQNIRDLYAEFSAKSIEILSTLEDKAWGQREFALRTIDGHRIMLGETINS